MSTAVDESDRLLGAVQTLRDEVERTRLPLDLPSTTAAEEERAALLHQLDDYVIPRLQSIDAPLLAVIGGSTGAGKSTLVNSLLGRKVSATGVIRPTTTSPVLVHHPEDARWFHGHRILPSLSRVTGDRPGTGQSNSVHLVGAELLPAGIALLDTPDIDSVVQANRALSWQLLAAADLWLFVTTAARYADAVPWELLEQAAQRGTAVAIVLNRVGQEDAVKVRDHLIGRLREHGLGTSPVFVIPESTLDDAGLLPQATTERLLAWLTALGGDPHARRVVIRQTLEGALHSIDARTGTLIEAARAQQSQTGALMTEVGLAYAEAEHGVAQWVSDGQLLRGEVLARWQEFVGTGEFFKKVESTVGRWRDRVTAAVRGRPSPQQNLGEALHTGVADLVVAQSNTAAQRVVRQWRSTEAGRALLAEHPELERGSRGFHDTVDRMVRDWQGEVLDLVRAEGADRRTSARIAAYGVNGVGLLLMLVAFSHTGGLVGAEIGIAGGTTVLAQKILEAIFGDQAVRTMAAKARDLLSARVSALLDTERARFETAVGAVSVTDRQVARLELAAAEVEAAS